MKTTKYLVTLLLFGALLVPTSAFAVVGTVILKGVGIDKLLNDFEDAASRLVSEGESSANAVVVNAGNQMRVAVQNADIAFKDRINQSFDNLSVEEQSFFTSLNSIISNLQSSINGAVSVAELFNLNLIELTNRLPFTKKTDFYIDKISGITQVMNENTYQIKIRGLGFGQDIGKKKYKFKVTVGDSEISDADMERIPPYELKLTVKKEILDKYFAQNQINFVPLNIKITAERKRWFGLRKTSSMTWPLKLTLMPKQAGTITGTEILVGKALDGITKTTSVTVTTSGCRSNRPCDWSREIPLASNERALGVRYACAGQCGWSYSLRSGGYAPDFDILNGGTKVVVYRHNDGENTTTGTYYVDYQTIVDVASEKKISPIAFEYNKPFKLQLDPGNTSCSYRLNAVFSTKQNTYIDNSMMHSPENLIVKIGAGNGPAGTACVPTFIANIP